MKIYKLLFAAVLSGTILLVNLAVQADNDKNGVVTIVRIQGHAEYSLDGGTTFIPALVGKYLSAGSILRSGDASIVDVLIGQSPAEKNVTLMKINGKDNPAPNIPPIRENNMIRLRPNTTLGIDKLLVPESDPTAISDAVLNLKKGRILASVKKVSPSSEYFVKIPNGVAAVRGTELDLSTDGSSSSCAVVSGTVWLSFSLTDANGNPVAGANGQPIPPIQVTLSPGQSFNLTATLVNQLVSTLTAGGAADIQGIIQQLDTIATAAVQTLDAGAVGTLTDVLKSVNGPIITITGGVGIPTDSGQQQHTTHP